MIIKTFTKNKSKTYFNYNFGYNAEGLQTLNYYINKLKKYDFKNSKKLILIIYNNNEKIKSKIVFRNPEKAKNYLKRLLIKMEV